MGNCCTSRSAEFAGEDWGSLKKSSSLGEKQRLLGGDTEGIGTCSSSSSSGNCKREVKIKITKRELEELMEKVEKQGLTMEEVMASFILNSSANSDFDEFHHFHRPWKPALQSIPEVN